MNYILFSFIFLSVIFIYLHIYHQLKKSNDLGIIKLDNPTKDELEEECDLKQPLFFKYNNDNLKTSCNLNSITQIYPNYYLNLFNETIIKPLVKKSSLCYSPVNISELQELLLNDKDGIIISQNNEEYLKEMQLNSIIQENDLYLKPPLTCSSIYDIIIGTKDATTKLEYNDSCRNYLFVTQGTIKLRLIPPQYSSSLYSNNDYIHYKFESPINVWDVQEEYKKKYYRVRYVDVVLQEGDIIYIPPYWWYSIKFNKISSISKMRYYTYMNYLSIIPKIAFHKLYRIKYRNNSIKDKLTINIDTVNNSNDIDTIDEQHENKDIKK
jgi:lysine-specific demethylase 8